MFSRFFVVSLVIVFLCYPSLVACRRTLAPSILPKLTTTTTTPTRSMMHIPKQLLRSTTPSLVIRGGSGGDDSISPAAQEDSGISWNSHVPVNDIPSTLLNKLDGSQTMRAKFEKLCREAQVCLCSSSLL